MAIILPTYIKDYTPYRYPDEIENTGISDYNFLYTPISKVFLFKDTTGKLTEVTIDFPVIDNLLKVNKQGARS